MKGIFIIQDKLKVPFKLLAENADIEAIEKALPSDQVIEEIGDVHNWKAKVRTYNMEMRARRGVGVNLKRKGVPFPKKREAITVPPSHYHWNKTPQKVKEQILELIEERNIDKLLALNSEYTIFEGGKMCHTCGGKELFNEKVIKSFKALNYE